MATTDTKDQDLCQENKENTDPEAILEDNSASSEGQKDKVVTSSKSRSNNKGKSSKKVPQGKSSSRSTEDNTKSDKSTKPTVNVKTRSNSKTVGESESQYKVHIPVSKGSVTSAPSSVSGNTNVHISSSTSTVTSVGQPVATPGIQTFPTPPVQTGYVPNMYQVTSPNTQGIYNAIPDYLQQQATQVTPRPGFNTQQIYGTPPMMNPMFMNPFLFQGFQGQMMNPVLGINQGTGPTSTVTTQVDTPSSSTPKSKETSSKRSASTPRSGSEKVKKAKSGSNRKSEVHAVSDSDDAVSASDDDESDCNILDLLSDDESDIGDQNSVHEVFEAEEEDHEDDFLLDDLGETKEEICEAAHEKTAKVVNGQWTKGIKNPASLDIQEVYKHSKRPENINSLVRPRVNEEIKDAAGTIPFNRDSTPRSICTAIVKGAINVADVMDALLSSKVRFPRRRRILESCERAIKCLSYGNAKLGMLRRQLFKPFLAHPYKKLCDHVEHPSHEWLYGENFGDASRNVETSQKMSNKMSAKKAAAQKIKKAHKFQQMKQRRNDYDNYGMGHSRNQLQGQGNRQSGYGPQSGYGGNYFWFPWVIPQTCVDSANYSFLSPVQFRQQYIPNVLNNQVPSPNVPQNVLSQVIDHVSVSRSAAATQTAAELPKEVQQRKEQEVACLALTVDDQVKENYVHNFPIAFRDFVAGGLGQNIHVWRTLTSDPSILKLLEGVELDFKETPVQHSLPHEIKFSEHETKLVAAELKKFLNWGIIEETTLEPGDFVSNLFTRPKKEPNRIRLILNLKKLNDFVRFVHFKMDGVDAVLHLIRPRVFMFSIDFTQSFYSIPVHPRYYRYLKCICLGKFYLFRCLPMGYSQSPLLFCKLLKVPLSYLREHFGHTNCSFVDDIFGVEDTFEEARQNSIDSVEVLQDCGYTVNVPKSDIYPEMRKIHIGLIFNSADMSVRITPDKCQKMIDLASSLLGKHRIRIRSLASLIGQMNAARYATRYGPLHTKSLEIAKNRALVRSHGDFDAYVSLSLLDEVDIRWWISHIHDAFMPILEAPISDIINTDASKDGFGYFEHSSQVSGGGRWSEDESQLHINCLELRAILLSLQALFPGAQNRHIKIFCDSQVAIGCIQRQGSTKSIACNTETRNLLLYCEKMNFVLTLAYIGTSENVEADFESRNFANPDTEWSLNQAVFNQICCIFQISPEIDLFAERLNKKLPQYCAWKPDPYASFVDAFAVQWSDFNCVYLFPPFALVGRVLQRFLNLPQTTHALLIVPFWKTSPWWTLVLQYLVRQPIILQVNLQSRLLVLEHDLSRPHPLAGRLKLLALVLSNSYIEARDFRQKFPTLLRPHAQTRLTDNIKSTTRDGFIFVVKNRLIPSLPHSIHV